MAVTSARYRATDCHGLDAALLRSCFCCTRCPLDVRDLVGKPTFKGNERPNLHSKVKTLSILSQAETTVFAAKRNVMYFLTLMSQCTY